MRYFLTFNMTGYWIVNISIVKQKLCANSPEISEIYTLKCAFSEEYHLHILTPPGKNGYFGDILLRIRRYF